MYVTTQTGELWPRGSSGAPKSEGCKNFVTFFSYAVWPTAMKFGVVRGIDA